MKKLLVLDAAAVHATFGRPATGPLNGEPVAQHPISQPAPARVTRPITGGDRPDLPAFLTRSVKR